jgi:hypothetical protein
MHCMRAFVVMVVLAGTSQSSWAVCGSRGGPAFRGPNGKCMGWAELPGVCGTPPTTRCTYEGGGSGDTGPPPEKRPPFVEGGTIPRLPLPPSPPNAKPDFHVRKTKTDGIACTSQIATARVTAACAKVDAQPECSGQVESVLKSRECVKLPAGTEAVIEAGSHSFDWVRFRVQGQPQSLWSPRRLLLN